MAGTSSLTRNQFHDHDDDDASSSSSSKKRSKSFGKGDVAPWSDVDHDLLLLVMMHLGFADFLAFSGVCKSWRSLALSNKKWFMASKPPMWIWRNVELFLEDFEEKRRFKTMIPHSAGRNFHGITCGYLIFYAWETRDFLLVNPITRDELEFPDFQMLVGKVSIKAILVFSPSISGRVFVVLHSTMSRSEWRKPKISFYIEGKQRWNHVSSTVPIVDIHFLKGKIYTLHSDCSVGELRLYPNRKRKWTLLETNNFLNPVFKNPELVSSGEKVYVISRYSNPEKVMELDIGEMKWVSPGKALGEYAFFISERKKSSAAMKLESGAGPQTPFESYACFQSDDKRRKCMFYYTGIWYFPHDCLTDNILDD